MIYQIHGIKAGLATASAAHAVRSLELRTGLVEATGFVREKKPARAAGFPLTQGPQLCDQSSAPCLAR
jgi:hypothetical protein